MRYAGLAALALVAACSSAQQDVTTLFRSAIGPELFKGKAQREAERRLVNRAVTADPEALRNFDSPILVINAEDLGVVAVIGPAVERGNESIWFSADGNSVAFRSGQIIATRGLNGDLQSADVPDIRRQRGEVVRDHYYRDGDEVIRRTRYFCEITDKGRAGAEVLDRIYPTRLIEEACSGDTDSFTNAYWIGNSGEIRLSRQWIGPSVGYLQVQKVQD